MDAKEIVAYHYPIQLEEILPLKEGKVWLVKAREGPFILKALHFPVEESLFIMKAMRHLQTAGFENFNRVAATENGESLVGDGGKYFFLSRFVPGRAADFTETADMESAVATLASFHRAARGFDPPPFPGRIKWGVWPTMIEAKMEDLRRFGEMVKKKRKRTHFDCLYLRHYPYYLDEMAAAAGYFQGAAYLALSRAEREAGGFCHHDLAHHNFLIAENGAAGLIDFDYAIADLRVHDLANFLVKLLKHHNWDEAVALFALEAYDKAETINREERRVLLGMLRFPQDFWQVAFARYAEESREALRLEKENAAVDRRAWPAP